MPSLVELPLFFLLMIRRPPRSVLFFYTTFSDLIKAFAAPRRKQLLIVEDDPQLFPSDRKSTRLNSSHITISYAVFCLKKKTSKFTRTRPELSTRSAMREQARALLADARRLDAQ